MDSLPRELQNRIVKRMDIDTRLKCGIRPGKLIVPELLVARLDAVLKRLDDHQIIIESPPYMFKRFHRSSDRKYTWYFASSASNLGDTYCCTWRVDFQLGSSFLSNDHCNWSDEA